MVLYLQRITYCLVPAMGLLGILLDALVAECYAGPRFGSCNGSLGMVVEHQLCYCIVRLHLLYTVPDFKELTLFNKIPRNQFPGYTPIRQLWDGRSGLLSS